MAKLHLPNGLTVDVPDDATADDVVQIGKLAMQRGQGPQQAPPQAPQQQSPGFWGELSNNLSAIPQTIMHPIQAVQGMVQNAKTQSNEVWDALTGGGQYGGKIQPFEAINHAVYAVPGVGPILQGAAKNFTSGNVGAGVADTLPLALPAMAEGAGAAWDAIPRVASAASKFQDVMSAAKDIPLDTTELQKIALKTKQLSESGRNDAQGGT